MTSDIRKLLNDISIAERKYKDLQLKLEGYRRACKHKWGEGIYDPIFVKSKLLYYDPYQGIAYGFSEKTPHWKRECRSCGIVEHIYD